MPADQDFPLSDSGVRVFIVRAQEIGPLPETVGDSRPQGSVVGQARVNQDPHLIRSS
jgi:hypothetical protein